MTSATSSVHLAPWKWVLCIYKRLTNWTL